MTKQEAIREGIALGLGIGMLMKDDAVGDDGELWMDSGYYFLTDSAKRKITKAILNYLHSQGVVIKHDGLGNTVKPGSYYYELEPLVKDKEIPEYCSLRDSCNHTAGKCLICKTWKTYHNVSQFETKRHI